ncbi:hypothetical protein [Staphylospora marina]|uniref:hypothetical protein n=1 Tax=Staphylospora marina TaxID=2490858 RepID=UPI000F5C0AAB|nr:hypothetical protein [Staphylospora marina]
MNWRHGIGGLICVCFLLILPTLAYAESPAPSLDELNSRVADLEDHRELLKEIGEEVKNYREHLQAEMTRFQDLVQKERDSFFTLFQFLTGTLTVLLGVAGYIVYYNIGQTKADLKKQMEVELDQTKKELHREFQQRLEEEKELLEKQMQEELESALQGYHRDLEQLRKQMEEQYLHTLEQFTRDVGQDLDALKKNIENEKTFTSSRIWVTGPEAEIEKMKTDEVDLISRRGIKSIEVKTFDRDQLKQALENNEIDILIYRYQPANGRLDQDLISIAKLLVERNEEVPLIVYGTNLKDVEMSVLGKYKFFTISNFRMTLISNIFSLAYAFNKQSNL